MRVFVYEWCTGGGLLGDTAPLPGAAALLVEGSAMVDAVAADFAGLDGVEVVTIRDARLGPAVFANCSTISVDSSDAVQQAFLREAHAADWTIVIAPEIDGCLSRLARDAIAAGGKLLGPSPDCIDLASDKHALAEHLAGRGVRVPNGCFVLPGSECPAGIAFPAVAKPRDGAGSQGIQILNDRSAAFQKPARVERLVPGIAASVAVLCGPTRLVALEPCRQRVDSRDNFKYHGGSLPLSHELADRARRLAQQAVSTLPAALGYLGVDLVLGNDRRGTDDYVIEINPRLTTSYIGLRQAAAQNIAAAMLAIAEDKPAELRFRLDPVCFHADGTVRMSAAAQMASDPS
ncbi:MAG TPA: ATP-grasp domain-containing protein [Pirellulales bacterium]|nr:ATP-grasp domain-containing protein [Pirellulales bacterium]